MFAGVRRIDRQRQVDEQLAKEEVAAGATVEHQGVLADPAEAGLFGDGFFQYRRAVDEGAVAERAGLLLDALGQLLQALADQLVVVAAQGVARYIGFLRFAQALGHLGVTGQVVHAQRDHPQGAGHQLLGMRALAAVGGHVVHLALVTGIQPALQVCLVLAQVQPGNADLLKAQFAAPILDRLGEGGEVECDSCHMGRVTGAEVGIILPDIGADACLNRQTIFPSPCIAPPRCASWMRA
ncbi:hypothetical protein D3C86_1535980 [compost metagenome]